MKTPILNYNNDSNTISKAVSILMDGGVGIFPTDTVYGIGCDCSNISALNKLYCSKKRDFNKPINILVSSIDMAKKYVNSINSIEEKLIENFWPGSLTIIFNKNICIPNLLTANLSTVGIRMPNSKICLDLINNLGSPIATSSANISEESPASEITEKLLNDFNNSIDFIIDSGKVTTIPSTIVKVENNEIIILRKGSITKSDIQKCFGGNINVR